MLSFSILSLVWCNFTSLFMHPLVQFVVLVAVCTRRLTDGFGNNKHSGTWASGVHTWTSSCTMLFCDVSWSEKINGRTFWHIYLSVCSWSADRHRHASVKSCKSDSTAKFYKLYFQRWLADKLRAHVPGTPTPLVREQYWSLHAQGGQHIKSSIIFGSCPLKTALQRPQS